jgi:hypothetical protein
MNIHYEQDFTVNLVQDLQAFLYWRPMIERCLERGHSLYTFTSLVHKYIMGERIFLYNDGAWAILQADSKPLGTSVEFCLGGGNKEALLRLDEDIYKFAKSIDAKLLWAIGRKGFKKWPIDWIATGRQFYIRDLNHG